MNDYNKRITKLIMSTLRPEALRQVIFAFLDRLASNREPLRRSDSK
jgi:hypothetical protein